MTINDLGVPFSREYKGKRYALIVAAQPNKWAPIGVYSTPVLNKGAVTYESILWRKGEAIPVLRHQTENEYERKDNGEEVAFWRSKTFDSGSSGGWNVEDSAQWHLVRTWTPGSDMDLNDYFVWNRASKTQVNILIRRLKNLAR